MKRRISKHGLGVLVILLALVLAIAGCSGCGSNPPAPSSGPTAAPPSSPPGVITSGPAGGASAIPSSDVSGMDTDSSDSEPVENSVTGVIEGAGMGRFQVKLEDGLMLEFIHEGADLSGLTDTRPGSPITVYFYGTINGNDTSGVTVTRMETPA